MGLFLKYWIPYPTVDATVVEATNQLQANKITQTWSVIACDKCN